MKKLDVKGMGSTQQFPYLKLKNLIGFAHFAVRIFLLIPERSIKIGAFDWPLVCYSETTR